ncbi:hypothetical protein SAMN05216193_101417 [Pseudomonas jinjuensis]|uniref:Uncharacterized protein n=1 Tax=Pseudomonas jinjuensis TaxID=198616 RepID=A0A1G9ZAA2_9PSED|nr:hypothetical protein SAMN05216193_101417 [Pseudomonas jinjuensis]
MPATNIGVVSFAGMARSYKSPSSPPMRGSNKPPRRMG